MRIRARGIPPPGPRYDEPLSVIRVRVHPWPHPTKMEGRRFEIPDLASFVVPNVKPTGRELGKGAYGRWKSRELCAQPRKSTQNSSISVAAKISGVLALNSRVNAGS